jgi:hypothetical protein
MERLGFKDRKAFLKAARRERIPFYRITARHFLWDESELNLFLKGRRVGRPQKHF